MRDGEGGRKREIERNREREREREREKEREREREIVGFVIDNFDAICSFLVCSVQFSSFLSCSGLLCSTQFCTIHYLYPPEAPHRA